MGIDVMIGRLTERADAPPRPCIRRNNEKGLAFEDKAPFRQFYFNFKKERESLAKNQTSFTSPVTLIFG